MARGRSPTTLTLVSSKSIRRIMRATGTSQLTTRLPLELLEKVLARVPVLDILRMKQVRRISDRDRGFQLSLPLARSLVASAILSRIHLTSSTELISLLQGWRITLPQTLLLPTNGEPSTNIARNGIPLIPSKSGNERLIPHIFASRPTHKAFPASLGTLNSSSSFLPWGPFHEGYRGKSGSSQPLSSTSQMSQSTLAQTCWLSLKGRQGQISNTRKSHPELTDGLQRARTPSLEHDNRPTSPCRSKSNHQPPTNT